MAKINNIIPPQNYEFVRDQVADILNDEIGNQVLLTGDYDQDAEVYVERNTPFNESELPAVNVSLDSGTWDNKHQGSVAGLYIINIDSVFNANTTRTEAGDTTASLEAQRMAGKVRAILEDPIYKTLGFVPPFISRTYCRELKIGSPNVPDMKNTIVARVALYVQVCETTPLKVPNLIESYVTTVRLGNSGRGYTYEGVNE